MAVAVVWDKNVLAYRRMRSYQRNGIEKSSLGVTLRIHQARFIVNPMQ